MKRILTFLLSLFSLQVFGQEKIHYSDYVSDEAPTEYPAHVALMSGLKGSYQGSVTVDAVLSNKMAVSANEYLKKSAEVCNSLNWAAEMETDGSEIEPGEIRWYWENGYDAIVTLDWAINSGTKNGKIIPYLELKSNKLTNQRCRVYEFKDGSILVMLKVGSASCANMFLRLLRAEAKPESKVKVKPKVKEEEEIVLNPPKKEEETVQLSQPKPKEQIAFIPTNWNFQQCCGGGAIIIPRAGSSGGVVRPGGGSSGVVINPVNGGSKGTGVRPG